MDKNSTYDEYKAYYDNEEYNERIVASMSHAEHLITKWYHAPFGGSTPAKNRDSKMRVCYDGFNVEGNGLELAFGLGTASLWLLEKFPNIILDGVDFQRRFDKIGAFLKELYPYSVGDYWIGDICDMPKDDDFYDFINSSSVWEHLTEEVYWAALKECYRVLKPNGKIFVYVDQTEGPEHIRVKSHSEILKEMQSVGFKPINEHVYAK